MGAWHVGPVNSDLRFKSIKELGSAAYRGKVKVEGMNGTVGACQVGQATQDWASSPSNILFHLSLVIWLTAAATLGHSTRGNIFPATCNAVQLQCWHVCLMFHTCITSCVVIRDCPLQLAVSKTITRQRRETEENGMWLYFLPHY